MTCTTFEHSKVGEISSIFKSTPTRPISLGFGCTPTIQIPLESSGQKTSSKVAWTSLIMASESRGAP